MPHPSSMILILPARNRLLETVSGLGCSRMGRGLILLFFSPWVSTLPEQRDSSLPVYTRHGRIPSARDLGARLMAGQLTLNQPVEVQILCPQPVKIARFAGDFAFCTRHGHKLRFLYLRALC